MQNNSQPKHWLTLNEKNKLTYKNKQKRVLIQKYTQHTKKLLADVTSQSVAIWQPGKWASTPTNCTFNCSGTAAAAAMIRAPPRVTHCSSSLTAETFIISCERQFKMFEGSNFFLRKVFFSPPPISAEVLNRLDFHTRAFLALTSLFIFTISLSTGKRVASQRWDAGRPSAGPTPGSFAQPMTADITWYYECTARLSGTCWICGLRRSNSPKTNSAFPASRAKLQTLGNSLWTRVSSKS